MWEGNQTKHCRWVCQIHHEWSQTFLNVEQKLKTAKGDVLRVVVRGKYLINTKLIRDKMQGSTFHYILCCIVAVSMYPYKHK